MTEQAKAENKVNEAFTWMKNKGYDRKASKDIAPILVEFLKEQLSLNGVGNPLNILGNEFDNFLENYCIKQGNNNEWCYQGIIYPLGDLIEEFFTQKKVGDI